MGRGRDDRDKTIVGYCEPLSLRAGGVVTLHASSHVAGPAAIDVVRIGCGDPTRSGPGYHEESVTTALADTVELVTQPLVTGSWGAIDLDVTDAAIAVFTADLLATRPEGPQTAIALVDGTGMPVAALGVDGGRLVATGAAESAAGAR